MPIVEDVNPSHYQVKSYQPGCIVINQQTYTQSLIVTSDQLIPEWPPARLEEINAQHIDQILNLGADIVLLGTESYFKKPPETLRAFDCMSTLAACRTFIALSAEERQVAAVLLLDRKGQDVQ